MPDFSQLQRFGEIGPVIGAAIALLLAVLQLPLLSEFWREVTPRRLRWLERVRQLLPPNGEFGAAEVIGREMEREVVFRLTRLRLTGAEFKVLAAINRDNPREVSWRIVRQWSDDIAFVDGRPRLTTGRFARFMMWVSVAYIWLLLSFFLVLGVLGVIIGVADRDWLAMAKIIAQGVPFALVAVLWARFMQSPYRWAELRGAFERHSRASIASEHPAPPAASESDSG
jgi:hypothetical protein